MAHGYLSYQNPEWRSKSKKDPGIPNLFPFKDKILAEIEEKRRLKEEENARRRQLAKEQKAGGAGAMELAEGDEELADEDDLLEEESEEETSMDVVSNLDLNKPIPY